AEQLENLEKVPGRVSQLIWAVGRLRFGLRVSRVRSKREHLPGSNISWLTAIGSAVAADVGAIAFAIRAWSGTWPWVIGVFLGIVLAAAAGNVLAGQQRRRRKRSK